MISTIVNEALGLRFPLFQGGMAWIADGKLAATVAQDPAAVGAKGLQLMVEAVENDAAMEPGAEVPVYGIDAILITSENASEYIK